MCADALEQLGYQAESGSWRNVYLTAALELRNGNSAEAAKLANSTSAIMMEMTAPMLFDYLAILLDKQALAEYDFMMNVTLTDVEQQHLLQVKNGVMLVYENTQSDAPDISITCSKSALFYLLGNDQEKIEQNIQVEGDAGLLTLLSGNLNQVPSTGINAFNIIEP